MQHERSFNDTPPPPSAPSPSLLPRCLAALSPPAVCRDAAAESHIFRVIPEEKKMFLSFCLGSKNEKKKRRPSLSPDLKVLQVFYNSLLVLEGKQKEKKSLSGPQREIKHSCEASVLEVLHLLLVSREPPITRPTSLFWIGGSASRVSSDRPAGSAGLNRVQRSQSIQIQ